MNDPVALTSFDDHDPDDEDRGHTATFANRQEIVYTNRMISLKRWFKFHDKTNVPLNGVR